MRTATSLSFVVALLMSPAAAIAQDDDAPAVSAAEESPSEIAPESDADEPVDEPERDAPEPEAAEPTAAEDQPTPLAWPAEPAQEDDDAQATEPPEPEYIQGVGRGFFYGLNIHSPSHLSTVQRVGPSFEALSVGPGVGLVARAGWEFAEGLAIELFGGLSVNGVDTLGKPIRNTFQRADVGLRGRYTIWTGTVVNPFVQVGVSARVYWFEWTTSETPVEAGLVLPVLHGSLGLSFDLTPFFAIDVGASAAYGFGGDIFNEGILFLSPFAGITLYLYDATGVI